VILGVFNVDRASARTALGRIGQTGARVAGFGHGEVVRFDAGRRIATATDPFG
jgi:hypothetical protein